MNTEPISLKGKGKSAAKIRKEIKTKRMEMKKMAKMTKNQTAQRTSQRKRKKAASYFDLTLW